MKEPASQADHVSNFSTCWVVGGRRWWLCYLPPCHTICCYGAGQASKLSTSYLYTGTPPRYSWTDVCVLMSPIRISLVAVPARLSYAQSVTRYRSHVWLAIDIAISAYRYNPYSLFDLGLMVHLYTLLICARAAVERTNIAPFS